ncbi:MAG: DUF4923 family protein [Muribaculaceae bacterium]|nr:DUF4923 family protein [Muribaculaceae bacterium]
MKNTLLAIAAAAGLIAMTTVPVSAGNPLDALSGLVSTITSTSKFELSDLNGTWNYMEPAISFKSDNALNKIGGTAASVAIVSKLKPYYEQLGINTMSLTVDADANFSMKIKSALLKGSITKDDDNGCLTFNFSAFGKIPLGKVSAKAEKSATGVLTLTFDVSRLVTIVDKVSEVARLSTVQSLVSLLKSYDGIYAGAKLKKVKGSESAASTSSSKTTRSDSMGESSGKTDDSGSGLGNALNGVLNAVKNRTGK